MNNHWLIDDWLIDFVTSDDSRVVLATSDLFDNSEWWGDLTWPTKRQRQRHAYKDTQNMKLELAEVNLGAKIWKKQRRLSAERLSTHQKRWNEPKVVLKCEVFLSLCLKGRGLRKHQLGKLSFLGQHNNSVSWARSALLHGIYGILHWIKFANLQLRAKTLHLSRK